MIARGVPLGLLALLLCGYSGQTDEPAVKKGGDQPSAKPRGADDSTSGGSPTRLATFGGGCFWCTEATFERVIGVKSVVSGYSGGVVPNPTYDQVCTGMTGHAEVIQIEYDPKVVTFEELLEVFWLSHDPTTLNRQGPDQGTQYRSIILYHDEDQRKAATQAIARLNQGRGARNRVVTQVAPLQAFFMAEPYHQDYYRNHPQAAYCQVYIAPKLKKIKAKLSSKESSEFPKADKNP